MQLFRLSHFTLFALSISLGAGLLWPARSFAQTAAAPLSTPPAATADAVQEAFVRVAERLKPSVVTIYSRRSGKASTAAPEKKGGDGDNNQDKENQDKDKGGGQPFPFGPGQDESSSLGTGIVISQEGYILTNFHVVKDADVLHVVFESDGKRSQRVTANLVGFDEESDLAVLKISANVPLRYALTPVTFADSDKVRIGEWAIAIGAPFDQAQSVTVGVISASHRYLQKDDRMSLQDYLQTDASINPGNSGGPLIDLEGKVIGINTAILSPQRFNVGIGYAVPSNSITRYLPRLLKGEPIERGFLGIQYVEIDPEVAREFGVQGGMQIGALAKQGDKFIGPAKDAGLQEGDIITHINGKVIADSDAFRAAVAGSPPGTIVQFTVVRPSNTAETQIKKEITVTLGDWKLLSGEKKPSAAPVVTPIRSKGLGLKVQSIAKLPATEKTLLGWDDDASGIVITEVLSGGAADDVELKRGLKISRLRLSGKPWQSFDSAASFEKFEQTLQPGGRVLIQLRDRQNVSLYKLLVAR